VRGSQSRRPDVTLLSPRQVILFQGNTSTVEASYLFLYVPVVVSLGCSPRKQRLARWRHDEVGLSYEPHLLFVSVSVCFEFGC
jgi:hypothetical protein